MIIDDEPTPTPTSTSGKSIQEGKGAEGGKGMTLEKLLYKKLYITLRDNREIVGVFICIDRSGNILLRDCEEFIPLPSSSKEEEVRRNREMFWPKSERYFPHSNVDTNVAGEQGGNQEEVERGREIGMVGIKWKDLIKVQISDDDWLLHE